MLPTVQNFIPVLTSEAGLCLTTKNWQESKVNTVSYALERLLFKPGLEMLKKITDLGRYLAWPGVIVLNAMALVPNKEGIFILKSPYEGSTIKFSLFDLAELIQCLKPNKVILPKNILQNLPQIWDKWHDATIPFIHVSDLEKQEVPRPHGVYFDALCRNQFDQWIGLPRYIILNSAVESTTDGYCTDSSGLLADFLSHRMDDTPSIKNQPKGLKNQHMSHPRDDSTAEFRIIGHVDLDEMRSLRHQGIEFIETDVPANEAMQGRVYNHSGIIDLTDERARMQFEPIDADCICPTCSHHLTRAYLHHLLQNTPLLCQRFLIQHNVFYAEVNA